MKIFQLVKAATFFPAYAPTVANWRHKMRGKSGHDIPLEFTTEDVKAIRDGAKNMLRDIISQTSVSE